MATVTMGKRKVTGQLVILSSHRTQPFTLKFSRFHIIQKLMNVFNATDNSPARIYPIVPAKLPALVIQAGWKKRGKAKGKQMVSRHQKPRHVGHRIIPVIHSPDETQANPTWVNRLPHSPSIFQLGVPGRMEDGREGKKEGMSEQRKEGRNKGFLGDSWGREKVLMPQRS